MISYGDAIDWCIKNNGVFRFINRSERPTFVIANEKIPGDKAMELAADIHGKACVIHAPLDSSTEPSKAVARALIACVDHFAKMQKQSYVISAN